ncbi:hypothetical protein Tco_0208561, partial [Tanacetum coccineum]
MERRTDVLIGSVRTDGARTRHIRLDRAVGEKHVTVEQFKECLTYYALANGFSLWYERSSRKKMVAKCGQRPPRLSVPKKDKQRKQSRYPSASKMELLLVLRN